jgi:hypothetical protein
MLSINEHLDEKLKRHCRFFVLLRSLDKPPPHWPQRASRRELRSLRSESYLSRPVRLGATTDLRL